MQSIISLRQVAITLLLVLPASVIAQEQAYTLAGDLQGPKLVLIHGEQPTPILAAPGNKVPDHLKEFGFYLSGAYADDDDVLAVAPYSTFVDVNHYSDVFNNTSNIKKMQIAKGHGLKLWVGINWIFFTDESDGHRKRADYLERWDEAKNDLEPFRDIIYAFDPLDEPFDRSEMSDGDLKTYLEEIAGILEVDFPNARRSLVFAKNTVEKFAGNYNLDLRNGKSPYPDPLPENWDLIGVDNYRNTNFASGTVEDLMSVTQELDVNYFVIPQAFQSNNPRWAVLSEEQMITKARQAYNFAISHPRVEVLRPFRWHTDREGQGSGDIGVESFPKLRAEYEVIGSAISRFR